MHIACTCPKDHFKIGCHLWVSEVSEVRVKWVSESEVSEWVSEQVSEAAKKLNFGNLKKFHYPCNHWLSFKCHNIIWWTYLILYFKIDCNIPISLIYTWFKIHKLGTKLMLNSKEQDDAYRKFAACTAHFHPPTHIIHKVIVVCILQCFHMVLHSTSWVLADFVLVATCVQRPPLHTNDTGTELNLKSCTA